MSKVMVVLSGGQDSTTCLALAAQAHNRPGDEVHAITFMYGQRHATEIDAAKAVAKFYGVKSHEIVHVPDVLKSTSPLTSDTPLETYTDFPSMDKTIGDRVELTFVPLRNPFFLLVAANHALALGCDTLVTGICEADNANYPDCTGAFRWKMAEMINEALGRNSIAGSRFTIQAPLLHLNKQQTVELMMRLPKGPEALAFTHTCYAGEVPPCGKCHACVLRAKGFEDAGVADPLVERFKPSPAENMRAMQAASAAALGLYTQQVGSRTIEDDGHPD